MSKILRDLNYKLNSYERMFQKNVLDSFPIDVCLPTGDKCNFECIFCADRKSKIKFDNVTFEDFHRFADQLPLNLVSFIQIQGGGEPLFNPDYEKIFDYVVKNGEGAQISFNTNGLLLNEKWIDKLSSKGRILINISLNAFSKETYKCLTGSNNFDKVIDNIKLLIETRKEKKRESPLVSISFIGMQQNINELPEFINLGAELGVNFIVLRELMILSKEHEKYSLNNSKEKTTLALQQALKNAKDRKVIFDTNSFPVHYFLENNFESECVEEINYRPEDCYYPEDLTLNIFIPGECNDPWTSFVVDIMGNVKICCYSDVIMGNLFEQNFSEIWNGDMYRYYRQTVNTRNPPQECALCVKKR